MRPCQVVIIRSPEEEEQQQQQQNNGTADLLEPIPEGSRMCVEYVHVSAEVPAVFAPPGLFPGLELPSFGRKTKEDAGPKTRQVRTVLLAVEGLHATSLGIAKLLVVACPGPSTSRGMHAQPGGVPANKFSLPA